MSFSGLVIAIVGGDRREQEIARCAAATGAEVRGFGFPWPADGLDGVLMAGSAADALQGADIALFPIPGIAADGALFAPRAPERIIPTSAMLSGMRAMPTSFLVGPTPNLAGPLRDAGHRSA